jgi:hypothetical protein
MKSSVALLTTVIALGTGLDLLAQDPNHAVTLPTGGAYSNTGIGTTSKNAGGGQRSDDNSNSNVDGDDSVVRLNTQQSLAAGAMSRDEGQLTAKRRAKEKVAEVDSIKKLKTSGTDPKFQGSLLHSSVTSIDDVGAKPSQDGEGQVQSGEPPLRHKVFITESTDKSKTNETNHAKADSSPTPTPSPSVSSGTPNR